LAFFFFFLLYCVYDNGKPGFLSSPFAFVISYFPFGVSFEIIISLREREGKAFREINNIDKWKISLGFEFSYLSRVSGGSCHEKVGGGGFLGLRWSLSSGRHPRRNKASSSISRHILGSI